MRHWTDGTALRRLAQCGLAAFVYALLGSAGSAAAPAGDEVAISCFSLADGEFDFMSAIHSNPEVDVLEHGFTAEVPLAYAVNLWKEGSDRSSPDVPNIIRNLRRLWGEQPPERLILNVEHWPVGLRVSVGERERSIDSYIIVAEAAREALPETRIGFYAILPVREYWIPVKGDADEFAEWRAANRQLMRLAEHVDFVAPSLYTFYDHPAGWRRYAEANIAAARTYGKPVYPFLWPLYHNSNSWRGEEPIARDYWNMQLEQVRRLADGVIVWNGPYERWRLPPEWFRETGRTIERLQFELACPPA